MNELVELLIELLLEGIFAVLAALITSRKEKSDRRKWMNHQQEEQILAGEGNQDCVSYRIYTDSQTRLYFAIRNHV